MSMYRRICLTELHNCSSSSKENRKRVVQLSHKAPVAVRGQKCVTLGLSHHHTATKALVFFLRDSSSR